MTLSLHRSVRAVLSIFAIAIILFQVVPRAATGTIMPSPYQTVLDTNGNPVSGAKICTFLAGTTTNTATYTDSALSVANSNPIVADSAGRFTAYLSPGASYKFTYQDSTGTAGTCNGVTIKTVDNIFAVPSTSANLDITGTAGEALTAGQAVYLSDGSGGKTAGQWYKADSANTYSSSTAVSVGMVPASILSAGSGTIRLAGSVTGLTSLTLGTTYYIGTAGALTSTRPSNWRVLGVADSTSSLILESAPATSVQWTVVTTTSTGTQNDFAPGLIGNTIVRANNATLLTLNGLLAGYDGQRVIIEGIGGGEIDLATQNAGSVAANRFLTYFTTATVIIPAGGGSAEAVYDGTTARWRVVSLNSATTTGLTLSAGSTSGTQNDWAPGINGNTTFVMSSATDLTVTGIAGGYAGLTVTFINSGAGGNLFFTPSSGSSVAANRLINAATVGNTPVGAGGWITYTHNGTNWKLTNHEQGAWITPTFAAGSFTASAGTWTVGSGDVVTYAYTLSGRRLTVAWYLNTTTTSAGMGSDLRVAIPGGFTSAKDITLPIQTGDNNVSAIGLGVVASGGGTFIILRLVGSTAWTSGVTDLTFVRGEMVFEVQ